MRHRRQQLKEWQIQRDRINVENTNSKDASAPDTQRRIKSSCLEERAQNGKLFKHVDKITQRPK